MPNHSPDADSRQDLPHTNPQTGVDPQYVIKDFGNEYVLFKNGKELFTCWSPEDAERIADLMFQLDYARDTLWLIHENRPQDYCKDAFKPEELYDNVQDVAHHAWSMTYTHEGMYLWALPCPECGGSGCDHCQFEGEVLTYTHPSDPQPTEQRTAAAREVGE